MFVWLFREVDFCVECKLFSDLIDEGTSFIAATYKAARGTAFRRVSCKILHISRTYLFAIAKCIYSDYVVSCFCKVVKYVMKQQLTKLPEVLCFVWYPYNSA